MEEDRLETLINAVVKELIAAGAVQNTAIPPSISAPPSPAALPIKPPFEENKSVSPVKTLQQHPTQNTELVIDLPDPTNPEERNRPGISNPIDPDGLTALMETTTARIGVGRAGPRSKTNSLLLFQSDLAVTQDALLRDVDPDLLKEFKLFSVQTCITNGKQEYLLRPDLGRQLSTEAKKIISERCTKKPNIQVCIGDGLSAAAIEANLRKIFPVLQAGCKTANLSFGTPFFIQYCRVGVMNDIGDIIQPDVLILLIGERPGLGRADSMSAYMAYHPQNGHTDAERDVICNIYDGGGTNPLEAGAYALQVAQKMIRQQASGVKLKIMES